MSTVPPPTKAAAPTIELIEFKELQQAVERQFNVLQQHPLVQMDVTKDDIWQWYLISFPEGTNPRLRERTEHDCNTCKSFMRRAGGLAAIINGEIKTLWDIQVGGQYQAVVDALAEYVKSCSIRNAFRSDEPVVGQLVSRELMEDKSLRQWNHFHLNLPRTVVRSKDQIGPELSEFQSSYSVFIRALEEITVEALDTVLELISQNSLYRGEEKKRLVEVFRQMKLEFLELNDVRSRSIYAWSQVLNLERNWATRARSDVIGTLLVDLSENVDLDTAVRSYESKVAPASYKRPTAVITPRMKEAAKKAVEELGLMPALERRYARVEDLQIENLLYVDRNVRRKINGDVFDDLELASAPLKNLDKIEEVSVDKFVSDILPTAKSIEVLVENRHSGNLVSLIAPYDLTAPHLFKWPNPFSWSYTGDLADSIRERVKAAGGNVTGEVCCRLAWFNHDDLDLHMVEPNKIHIFYANKKPAASKGGGQLDVDMNAGGGTTRTPVENIFYPQVSKMLPGTYLLYVHQFAKRENQDMGFEIELEIQGQSYKMQYSQAVHGNVRVAELHVENGKVAVNCLLPQSTVSKTLWGIRTQEFNKVSAIMLSPNHWGPTPVGNKHFFFMIDGCKNDGTARGFYNEFLKGELEPHRKTMELVGNKMRTEETENQLSGLGFSSTKHDSLVVRVQGAFQRVIRVVF